MKKLTILIFSLLVIGLMSCVISPKKEQRMIITQVQKINHAGYEYKYTVSANGNSKWSFYSKEFYQTGSQVFITIK